jgi:hypothetical protein
MPVVSGPDLPVDRRVELREAVGQGNGTVIAQGNLKAVEAPMHRTSQLACGGAIDTDTSGGSSDTDVNELAARPVSWPSTAAASATAPVGKIPNTGDRRH